LQTEFKDVNKTAKMNLHDCKEAAFHSLHSFTDRREDGNCNGDSKNVFDSNDLSKKVIVINFARSYNCLQLSMDIKDGLSPCGMNTSLI
jgi:hypothetical protein